MLLSLFFRLFGPPPEQPPLEPFDPAFWARLGHSTQRAEEIAQCFPEYWQRKGFSQAKAIAKYCLARELGDIPLHWQYPKDLEYAMPDRLPDTDPIKWCQVNRRDLYPLDEAVRIAVQAAKKKGNRKLDPHRHKWHELRSGPFDWNRERLRYSADRIPMSPLFWRQLGQNPPHARRIVRCFPEYWLRHSECTWKRAVVLATRTFRRLARQLKTADHNFYLLAETTNYDIRKRDPVYWFSQGLDWEEAPLKAINEACRPVPEGCKRMLHLRDLLHKAGRKAELLHDGAVHLSGPRLGFQQEYEQAQAQRKRRASLRGAEDGPWPRWGPLELNSPAMANAHCCAVGAPGAGTEILLSVLMNSVSTDRWLVVAGKNDLLPAIRAMRPDDQLYVLNPLDVRSSAWHLAEDATTARQTLEIVTALVPDDPSQHAMLIETARALLTAIIQALNLAAPGHWDLLHVIAAAEPTNLPLVLLSHPQTAKLYHSLLANPHARLAIALLEAQLRPLKPAAAAWQHAKRRISISAWLQSRSALLLASSLRDQHLLAPMNRILFQLIAGRLIEPHEPNPDKTWVFLADLCQIGRLESLSPLLTRAPQAGVTVALTLDDLEILQRHYGPEATALVSLCGNYAFVKITNPATARWASQRIGIEQVKLLHETESTLAGNTTRGVTVTSAERPLVPPTAFQELPLASEGRGPVGFFKSPRRRVYKGEIDLQRFTKSHWLSEPTLDQPAFVPCPDEHLQFPQETAGILKNLGFAPETLPRRPALRKRATSKHFPATAGHAPEQEPTGATEFDPDDFPRLDIPSE